MFGHLKLPLSVLIVGVLGMGTFDDKLVEALARARHSDGIEFTILIRKNLCSGDVRGVRKSSEKEQLTEITSPILRKPRSIKSFLYVVDLLSKQINLLFQII